MFRRHISYDDSEVAKTANVEEFGQEVENRSSMDLDRRGIRRRRPVDRYQSEW